MKIELPAKEEGRAFHLVHPACCFIPLSESTIPPPRNVWFKITEPNGMKAVNLHSGVLAEFGPDTPCKMLSDAKVVIG